MSYWVRLNDAVTGEVLEVNKPHFIQGGNYCANGSTELSMNVTYNYGTIIYEAIGGSGVKTLNGMTGAEAIPLLKEAIGKLKDDVSDDYWEPTEGNAKRALIGLLAFAQMRPDGVFEVD